MNSNEISFSFMLHYSAIFKSKNSLLIPQSIGRETKLDNPEILIKDRRIIKLDEIVTEVKQAEEWEAVQMNILEIGIQKGREEAREEAREEMIKLAAEALIQDNLEEGVEPERICQKLVKRLKLTEEQAQAYMSEFM